MYLVALLSSLSGQTSCVQIADYWSNHRAALETVFEDFPKQDISHDTVRRLLMLIDPEQFQGFYGRLVEPLLHKFTSRIVAVDGQAVKASRRSGERAGKYILTFYDTENGIALGQSSSGARKMRSRTPPQWLRGSIWQDALLRPMRSIRRKSSLQL